MSESDSGSTHRKIAIDNVKVFDGEIIRPRSTVIIDGNIIGDDDSGISDRIDGQGGVLLPGFIESHSHPRKIADLQSLTSHGITTAFQLACFSKEHVHSFQKLPGLVDIYSAGAPAAAPGSTHGNMIQNMISKPNLLVQGEEDVTRWVNDQISWEPDFIKLIAQTPGLSQESLNALVVASHGHGKQVVCHAADANSHAQAMQSGADQIHHTPLDGPITADLAQQVLSRGQIVVPTLSVMKAFAGLDLPGQTSYESARESLRIYHEAGVPIIAGTDANHEIAAVVSFGKSFHDELELMMEAGMTSLEVLRSATVLPAKHWNLNDRGVIEPGKRADLVLIAGDPITDIKAIRNVKRVWVAGEEYTGPRERATEV
uniref:Amidohydrolase-related domain-containing protein n=1 Tax=Bionectria ochroleuca TaxID=29856 RepID=A0A8H7NHI8_BIOOC